MLPIIDQPITQGFLTVLTLAVTARFLVSLINFLRDQITQQKLLIDRINRCLPQTQCGQCSYEGCRPYARAIARGEAINKCPPGGSTTINKLAVLMNEPISALDPAHGESSPLAIAVIREDECIGCTKCIVACPVDAILGGPKLMHTVLESECTGCDLCVEPCPVDCIDMVIKPLSPGLHWSLPSRTRKQIEAFGQKA